MQVFTYLLNNFFACLNWPEVLKLYCKISIKYTEKNKKKCMYHEKEYSQLSVLKVLKVLTAVEKYLTSLISVNKPFKIFFKKKER